MEKSQGQRRVATPCGRETADKCRDTVGYTVYVWAFTWDSVVNTDVTGKNCGAVH